MILRPLLSTRFRPVLRLPQTRTLRSTIKINKHTFQITLDVHQFNKDEIRVKARPEHVLIEGKHERKTANGYVVRKFLKKIKLPPGCDPGSMKSRLSEQGILTITAERECCETNLPCETLIPIGNADPQEKYEGDCFVNIRGPFASNDPCADYACPPKDKRYTIEEAPDKGNGRK